MCSAALFENAVYPATHSGESCRSAKDTFSKCRRRGRHCARHNARTPLLRAERREDPGAVYQADKRRDKSHTHTHTPYILDQDDRYLPQRHSETGYTATFPYRITHNLQNTTDAKRATNMQPVKRSRDLRRGCTLITFMLSA